MRLRLMLQGPSRLMSAIPEKTLETGAMIVGRAAEADWSIPDPARVLSKAHCRIERKEDGFYLTDLSTNGVRINAVPVVPGVPHPLGDGETLLLGDAIVGVTVERLSAPPPPAAMPAPAAAGLSDPFPDGPFGFDAASRPTEPAPTPAAATAAPIATEARIVQDWWDPNAASRKSDVQNSANHGPGSADAPTGTVPPASETTTRATGMEDIVMMAATVDKAALIRAVDAAVCVLETERDTFMQRLRQSLNEESSRWG